MEPYLLFSKDRLYIEGNNGGDYLELRPLPDGRVYMELGHCCVKLVSHTVPVEFITGVLGKLLVPLSVEDAMRGVDWPKDFIDKLVAQIEPDK